MPIRRLRLLPALLANFINPRVKTPPLRDLVHYFFAPGREKRASHYIEHVGEDGEFRAVKFRGRAQPFFYPKTASWSDLCATVDECFYELHWHHYVTAETPIEPDDVIADCGGAEGLFTYLHAEKVKRVHLFEPVPKWVASLRKNFLDDPKVVIHACGVGEKAATVRMTDNEIFSSVSNRGTLEVPIKTLDEVFLDAEEPLTFLKADVEGFEFQALQGAEETIKRHKPKIAVTVYHPSNNVPQIQMFLENLRPDYCITTKGLSDTGSPVMLHAH
jgi:FkbM family methyltransferase